MNKQGYEVINLEWIFSDDDLCEISKKTYIFCVDELLINKKEGKSEKELNLIWLCMTSRGEDKLIYGKRPF